MTSGMGREPQRLRGAVLALMSLAGLLLFLSPTPVHGVPGEEGGDGEGEPIQAVRVEGLKTLGETYVRSRMETAPGSPLSRARLDQDIGRLYATGYFAEVKVRREPAPGGQVLVLEVLENPLISEVRFRGNKALSDTRLSGRLRTPLQTGETRYLTASDRELDEKAIAAAYREKAFLFARIQSRLEPSTGEATQVLVFEIEEGSPVPVKKIRFRGNKAFKPRRLKGDAPILTKAKLLFFRAGALDLQVLQDDAVRVRDFYRAHGYLDAQVKASQELDVERKRAEVLFDIEEGDLYHIGAVNLKMAGEGGAQPLVDAATLLPKFKAKAGKAFSLADVQHDVEKVKEEYGNLGHLVAQAVPRYTYRTVGREVDVTLDIQEGPKVRIGRVEVEGNTRTRDKIVRREMLIHPGDWFNYAKLKRSVKKLHNLRYFDSIQPRLEESGDPDERDLTFKVNEDKTGRFNYGAGYSDEAGVFGTVRITQTNFDSADLKRFPGNAGKFFLGDAYVGGGQVFSLSATPGQNVTRYDMSYSEPWLYDRPIGLGVNAFLRTQGFVDYTRDDQGASITLSRRFGQYLAVGSTLSTKQVRISGVAADAPQALKDSEGSFVINAVSPFVRWDTRDDPYLPSSGQMNQLGYDYTGGPVLGGLSYWQVTEEYQHFWTLHQDEDEQRKHIIAASARTAMVEARYKTGELPVDIQYFLGGASTVRGFNYRTITPKVGGVGIGGRFYLLTNLEYTFPVYEEILRGALFADRGTVEPSIRDSKPLDDFRSAWGFGMRIQLPISPLPISLDVAFPLEKHEGDSERVFTFNFGSVF